MISQDSLVFRNHGLSDLDASIDIVTDFQRVWSGVALAVERTITISPAVPFRDAALTTFPGRDLRQATRPLSTGKRGTLMWISFRTSVFKQDVACGSAVLLSRLVTVLEPSLATPVNRSALDPDQAGLQRLCRSRAPRRFNISRAELSNSGLSVPAGRGRLKQAP
ncbi:hypothetical protein COCON_G00059790 [Conger conger]|uniref:Uncharacterized protein n=1 Tax=Conger conger TaxID=82655 RepID=A0A9Q1I3G9_CONCO|nr:hypothetical protein COCON_G00059790 [Conger conger]